MIRNGVSPTRPGGICYAGWLMPMFAVVGTNIVSNHRDATITDTDDGHNLFGSRSLLGI